MRISTLASGRDNNFNLVRMVAASAVLVSHAFPLAGEKFEPLDGWAPGNLGRLAVALFFSISGFFIAKSFDRRSSLVEFVVDRVLRIYPALFAVLFLTVFVLGPCFTTLPFGAYFSSKTTWRYLPEGLSLFRLRYFLPGVFESNPSAAVNGSLWTLFFEVGCYGGVALAGLVGALRGRRFAAALALLFILYIRARLSAPATALSFWAELGFPFAVGVVFYVLRERIRLSWLFAPLLILATWAFRETPLYREIFVTTLIYITFLVGAVKSRLLLLYNRLGDYSYGIYILAFPIEQMVVAERPGIGPVQLALIAGMLTLIGAIISWHVLEGPVLDRRRLIGRGLAERLGWPLRRVEGRHGAI